MRHAVFIRDNSSEGGHWFDSRFLARWVQYRAIHPLTRRTLNHNELTRIHTAARRPSSNSNSNSNSNAYANVNASSCCGTVPKKLDAA